MSRAPGSSPQREAAEGTLRGLIASRPELVAMVDAGYEKRSLLNDLDNRIEKAKKAAS
jgi:hypothetical protein